MRKSVAALGALTLVFGLAAPAFAEENPVDQVVATVNGVDITVGHMLLVRVGLPDEYSQVPAELLWDGILNQLVQQEVLAQSRDAEETQGVQLSLENHRRNLLASGAITKLADRLVTADDVQAEYQARYIDANAGKEFNASHILLATEEEALAVMAEVSAEGADFAAVAREKSTGPSGPNGGELGWFGAGMMVGPFQAAVELMEVGEVSGPVRTQFGWHVIKLNDLRSAEAPPFEQVQESLKLELQQTAVQASLETMVASAEVVRTADEDLDRSVLGRTDLLTDQ